MFINLHAEVEEYEVSILMEDENKECYLSINLLHPIQRKIIDDYFPNAIILSANLAGELGSGPASDFLHAHNVPKESLLWHLNHSGYSKPVTSEVAKIKVLGDSFDSLDNKDLNTPKR